MIELIGWLAFQGAMFLGCVGLLAHIWRESRGRG